LNFCVGTVHTAGLKTISFLEIGAITERIIKEVRPFCCVIVDDDDVVVVSLLTLVLLILLEI
jgi:hypothetical protein